MRAKYEYKWRKMETFAGAHRGKEAEQEESGRLESNRVHNFCALSIYNCSFVFFEMWPRPREMCLGSHAQKMNDEGQASNQGKQPP